MADERREDDPLETAARVRRGVGGVASLAMVMAALGVPALPPHQAELAEALGRARTTTDPRRLAARPVVGIRPPFRGTRIRGLGPYATLDVDLREERQRHLNRRAAARREMLAKYARRRVQADLSTEEWFWLWAHVPPHDREMMEDAAPFARDSVLLQYRAQLAERGVYYDGPHTQPEGARSVQRLRETVERRRAKLARRARRGEGRSIPGGVQGLTVGRVEEAARERVVAEARRRLGLEGGE